MAGSVKLEKEGGGGTHLLYETVYIFGHGQLFGVEGDNRPTPVFNS